MAGESTEKTGDTGKSEAILHAAFAAFAQYGFRRTSMQDIAAGAGMSRAALYLHYRNKEDIFRSLAQYYYERAQQAVLAALTPVLPAHAALLAAFEAQGGEVMQTMLTSPHGAELMDTKYASSGDIAIAGEARIATIYADWLRREAAAGRVDLAGFGDDATGVAVTMITALHGLKQGPMPSYAAYCASVQRLALLFGRGLAV
ncbi:MAG: helix-turn-helix domain-containing protein [Rhodobacterales bacterium]|nr:helix-turn-helix domain-containing protein [Rhodobacterales bacterium]